MDKIGIRFALTTAIISGISIFLNKFGVSGIDSDIFIFSKNVVVTIFLFSSFLFYKQNFKLNINQWFKLGVIGLVGGSIPFILFFKGLQLTSGSSASLIHKSMFIFVTILGTIFLKEKVNKKFLLGAMFLLIGNSVYLNSYYPIFDKGFILILSATLFWAVETIISKKILDELSSDIVAFGRMFFGSIFILGYLVLVNKIGLVTKFNVSQVGWIVFTSVMLYLYIINWYKALSMLKVSVATSILSVGSVVTTFLSFSFTLNHIIGSILLLVGTYYVTRVSSSIKVLNRANTNY